jgi:hypothetical protein
LERANKLLESPWPGMEGLKLRDALLAEAYGVYVGLTGQVRNYY